MPGMGNHSMTNHTMMNHTMPMGTDHGGGHAGHGTGQVCSYTVEDCIGIQENSQAHYIAACIVPCTLVPGERLSDLQNKHRCIVQRLRMNYHNTLSSVILLHLTTKYSRNSVFHVKLLCLYAVRVHPRSHARPPALSTARGGMGACGGSEARCTTVFS